MDVDTGVARDASPPRKDNDHDTRDGTKASDAREKEERRSDDDDEDNRDSRNEREGNEREDAQGKTDVETLVVAPAQEKVPRVLVDRTKTCPFLLRVFPKENEFNRMDELARARLPQNELQIYTWRSETLRNLTHLIKSQLAPFRAKDTQFHFGAAYPDNRGNYTMRELGMTQGGRKGSDDQLSLQDLNFKVGDYILVKVVPPRDNGPRRGDFRGSRDGRDGRDGRGRMDHRDRDRDRNDRRRW